jgi:hypothetical protein
LPRKSSNIGLREGFLANRDSDADLKTFLHLCNLTADALAAGRATKFLPIVVAQGFFVGAIAVAIAKVASNTHSSSFFINLEVHSIAFSALYLWILPAVFLTSVIGVSQTQNAVPRILRRFQDGFDHKLQSANIRFPNDILTEEQTRVITGGIYSWKPDREDVNESKSLGPLLQRNLLPLLIVIAGAVTAWLVSASVPPKGWEPRLCTQAMLLLTWLLSFSLTCLFKRYLSSSTYNEQARFWLTFFKDLLATIATMGGIVVTQFGSFNRCDSYTRWDRTGLALPGQPDTAAVLAHQISTVYPAIVFTSIGLHMFVIPLTIAIWYRHALLVFMQRDDENSSPLWFLEWRWLRQKRSSTSQQRRPESYEHDPPGHATNGALNARTQFASKDGTHFETVESLPTGSRDDQPQQDETNRRQVKDGDLSLYAYYAAQLNLDR